MRIEFEKMTTEELKGSLKALLNGEEYTITVSDSNGAPKRIHTVKNGRLFIQNHWSIGVSYDGNGHAFLSVEYWGVDERIQFNKQKKQENGEGRIDI